MDTLRTRVSLGLISAAVIGMELALMRSLSLRFWSHLAYMVISIALLGFGASGTAATLLRKTLLKHPRGWLAGLALAMAASMPPAHLAGLAVDLDVGFLAWDLAQAGHVAVLELALFVPFFLAGGVVAVAMMDRPDRIGGHYAASLAGSGIGAVAAVGLMHVLPPPAQVAAMAAAAWAGGALLLPWRRPAAWLIATLTATAVVGGWLSGPSRPAVSPYKTLAQVRHWGDTQTLCSAEGPLGRIAVIAGPAIHYAPGLSLQFEGTVPPHALLVLDGEQAGAVYECPRREDWAFMDHTTAAAAYHLRDAPSVCVIGAGGGMDIGLAVFHRSRRVVALEVNGQLIDLMRDSLVDRGGGIYRADGVTVLNRDARAYFARPGERFDVIQLPPLDAFGASGAGLHATQESTLYTVESFEAMLNALGDGGVLSLTRWARLPPRDELRTFDMAAEALRRRGLDPAAHLAMIRSWATVTVLAFARPIGPDQIAALRTFCDHRSFDPCYWPGLDDDEVNHCNALAEPYYFQAAGALLGPRRENWLDNYVFDVAAVTDDRPYFFHSFRWQSVGTLREQLGQTSAAFSEAGYVMVVAALVQAAALAAVLIVLPLCPGVRSLRGTEGKAPALAYFTLLGLGFMLLEMGFLQRLILYLAHPIYSAAVVISSFLVFAGAGSLLSGRWRRPPRRVASLAGAAVVAIALTYVLLMDAWLALTQSLPVAARFGVAAVTIAPLAVAMGHMLPTGLRLVAETAPTLTPWAWAVNGFASVIATAGATLIAMHFGLARLTLAAVACYALAALTARRLGRTASPSPPR